MTATNHALTGALIGLTVNNAWIAIPAALCSHIICDIIPHFGSTDDTRWVRSKGFKVYLLVDAALCGLLVVLLYLNATDWLLAAVCAFVATSPDFLWIGKFRAELKNRAYHFNALERFLGWIQWFQRPIGVFVELAWFVGVSVLLWQFL